ncbi:MAG TPA: hypothetical protein VM582_04160, partial [Candidatus Thermoplasmatota archaeon]|nr:hypothetical protein [Candidatus Thermoplasmatota archaeon]
MVRAVALCLLLTAGSLLALVPPAPAQSTPMVICFDRDARADNGPCMVSETPDYPQGEEIRVRVPGWAPGTQSFLSARCVGGCPTGDPSAVSQYYVNYRGGNVRFPADFIDAGPNNDGGNAVLDRAPRYNSTWEFTLHIATPVQRRAHVWLYDAWEDDSGNRTVRPGATHRLTASGFDARAEVSYRWERRDPNSGRYLPFFADVGRADSSGVFTTTFQLPKSEGERIAACGTAVFDCYRVTVAGAGKAIETVNVQVGLADIVRSTATTPRASPSQAPVALQRSQNVSGIIDLYYPSGFLHTGPKFNPDDAPVAVRHGGRALRVAVEKVYVNNTVHLIDEVPIRFDPTQFVWVAQWTIPKDLPLEDAARYRLRLVEQRDVYGNRVAQDWLVNFTVERARLTPDIDQPFTHLERTQLGTLRLGVRYHNGSAFTPADAP